MNRYRLLFLFVFAALVAAFFVFDLPGYLTLDNLKAQQAAIEGYTRTHPFRATLYYGLVYVAVTALSLPGATILTLAGGTIFGLLWGTLIVSFASTMGATLAFLAARFLFREGVRKRFGDRLKAVDAGIRRDGPFYLFTLRLVPVFPFFVINLVMGLTAMPVRTFYWVSQLGMLPGTIVYVNAGTQLARIESPGDILSPGLLGSFALLGLFPWIAKWIVERIKARRSLARWPKPRRCERNLVIIGAGSAGLSAAYLAAAMKAKVTLVEKHRLGGDCLNTGCVPSKALIRTTRLLARIQKAGDLGIRRAHADFDFAEVMERVQGVIRTVEPHDSVERYTRLGVEVLQGEAEILSPWEVKVRGGGGETTLTTRAILIATGARPFVPPIPGLDKVGYLTSDTLWELRELPRRLLVLGGGPIGCELSQCFCRLGSEVIQVEMQPRLLAREDPEASEAVMARFRAEGIDVRVEHKALRFVQEKDEKILIAESRGKEVPIPFDQVLVAIGRIADTQGFGLEKLGISLSANGTIETNEYLQTCYPNIYACGDVAGPFQFTHTAAHQAWFAVVNALYGDLWKKRVDDSVIPWATFTDPEVARVGLNEEDARTRGIDHEVTLYELKELDRAIVDGTREGFVKVITPPGKDRILGVTIVGEAAGELIAEYVLAMKQGLGLNKILDTIHIYPTLAEANKYAAGVWRRNHTPERVLSLLERFHAWRRG